MMALDERQRVALKLGACLLGYPGDPKVQGAWHDRYAFARTCCPQAAAVMDSLMRYSVSELSRMYVTEFDLSTEASLYLTVHEHGETRERSGALLELAKLMMRFGYLPPDGEIADFLPMLLEFCAVCPEGGEALVPRLAAAVDKIRHALSIESPYQSVLDFLCSVLGAGAALSSPRKEEPDLDQMPYPVVYD